MNLSQLEHLNVTVKDPKATADWLCDIFGWTIRWQGKAKDDGYTVHVGSENSYLAIYSTGNSQETNISSYKMAGGLNHVGIVVTDLDVVESKVIDKGFKPHSHADYEPGRRFYFYDDNGIEFEVVSYQ